MRILVLFISIFLASAFSINAQQTLDNYLEKYYAHQARLDALLVKSDKLKEYLLAKESLGQYSYSPVSKIYWCIASLKTSFNLNSLINAFASYMALFFGLDVAYVYYPDFNAALRPALSTAVIIFPISWLLGNYIYKQANTKCLECLSSELAKELYYHNEQALHKAKRALFCVYVHTILTILDPEVTSFSQTLSKYLAYATRTAVNLSNQEPFNTLLFFTQLMLLTEGTNILALFIFTKILGLQHYAQMPLSLFIVTGTVSFIVAYTGLTFTRGFLNDAQYKIITYLDAYAAGAINYELADHYLNQAEGYFNGSMLAYNTASARP